MSLLPKTRTLNADYLFLVPTERFGTVGVAVADRGRWAGIGRMEDGSEPGLVTLLGGKQPERQYVTASPGRTFQLDCDPTSVLATIVEQAYSRAVDLQERGRQGVGVKQFVLSLLPFHAVYREMRQPKRPGEELSGEELSDLALVLLEYGVERGVVEPNYMNSGMIK